MTALALRQSGVFASVDVYEQTKVPSTAGAGLNIPPNGARLCRWLGVDLDGGDPQGPDGAIDGGRAATSGIDTAVQRGWERDEETVRSCHRGGRRRRISPHAQAGPVDVPVQAGVRVRPRQGAPCPITVHMDCRLTAVASGRRRGDRDIFERSNRHRRGSRGCRWDQLCHVATGVAEPASQALDRGDLLSRTHSANIRSPRSARLTVARWTTIPSILQHGSPPE